MCSHAKQQVGTTTSGDKLGAFLGSNTARPSFPPKLLGSYPTSHRTWATNVKPLKLQPRLLTTRRALALDPVTVPVPAPVRLLAVSHPSRPFRSPMSP